jgi:hypothetical protein
MKISIQATASDFNSWDEVTASIFDVETWADAVSLAYGVSKILGDRTVRLVEVGEPVGLEMSLQEYVGRLSGTYIQSR